jgi:ABC-type multidrug transport system fused ATPase/permease subunit
MVVGMLLEMLGVGLVTLALTGLTGGRSTGPSWLVRHWLGWLGEPAPSRLLLYGLGAVLGVFTFKALFMLFLAWRQAKFVNQLQGDLARRLFTLYLKQPWTFHLQRNSAILIRNMGEVQSLSYVCMALLGSLTELLTIAGILLLLVWLEPLGALAVGLMTVVATWTLDRLTRSRTTRWGQLRQHHQGACTQHMQQGFGGAKEVKILGRERFFIDQFITHMAAYCRLLERQNVFQQLPRLWYEVIAIASLFLLAVVLVWQGNAVEAILPAMGLFATAAFRLLPSINRLANSLQTLRFSTAVIDTIRQELSLPMDNAAAAITVRLDYRKEISVDGVTYRYPESHANSLENVSIRIPHGGSVGLVGGSGAGKSTLVDVILGLLTPSNGRVCVDGIDIAGNIRGWQALIGYVPQTIFLCDDTLRRNVALGIPENEIDDQRLGKAIDAAQLTSFVASLPDGVETMVGERGVRLSGGQRQRIGIARALYHDPEVLVLDEATSALDTATENEVMSAVNALHGQKTIVIVAHRLTTVSKCDIVYRLENGRVAKCGTLDEVIAQ